MDCTTVYAYVVIVFIWFAYITIRGASVVVRARTALTHVMWTVAGPNICQHIGLFIVCICMYVGCVRACMRAIMKRSSPNS